MNAVVRVFNIPELLENILLSFPCDTTHQELSATREIILAQTTCRSWHDLLHTSTPIRKRIYLSTPADRQESKTWQIEHDSCPGHPNPWISHLLLNQRSWGSAYPFPDSDFTLSSSREHEPRQPQLWTFTFEMSRSQYERLPPPGPWRNMLATNPPFLDCYYTRNVYELGSGRAPFVTHLDYDARKPKNQQKYHLHCESGITLGHLCDAMSELFDLHPRAKFVMLESCRAPAGGGTVVDLSKDRPTAKTYIPGSSAEKAHGWHRPL